MSIEISREEQLVKELHSKGVQTSTIGHRIRDILGVNVRKLTKKYQFLNQRKDEKTNLSYKVNVLNLHVLNNPKDYASERSLKALKVKLKRL